MPEFSTISRQRLSSCDERLQRLFLRLVETYDCSIIEGHRSKDAQDLAVAQRRSKTPWPTSKHNGLPSRAVDAGPYIPGRRIPWPVVPEFLQNLPQAQQAALTAYIKDIAQWHHFAGHVERLAEEMGIRLRWGGDWDRDRNVANQIFDDLPHFELVD